MDGSRRWSNGLCKQVVDGSDGQHCGANLGAGPVGPFAWLRTAASADLTITITEASLDGLRRAVANYGIRRLGSGSSGCATRLER